MLTTAYYFLQVILCSAVMMGYYWLVLRNKRFHQYNRFYLLAIALLSWIVPLIKIKWGHAVVNNQEPQVFRFLNVVAYNNTQIEEKIVEKSFQWDWNVFAGSVYFLVAGILLMGMIYALFRIYRLLKTHECKSVGDIYLILTNAKGTPFSFFRYIFWNEEIDLSSESGKQILQHELTHVQEKHSFDKLFMQVILIAGWFNPFFWLIKNELNVIHEFIADRKAIKNGDTASLAQMLLTAVYPKQQFMLTNPFFFSPIKRRLQMLTNNTNPKFSYIRRLVVLPLLAIVVILFAFRNKEQKEHTLSIASVVETAIEKGRQLLVVEDIPMPTVGQLERNPFHATQPIIYLNTNALNGSVYSFLNNNRTINLANSATFNSLLDEQMRNRAEISFIADTIGPPKPGINFQGIAKDPFNNIAKNRAFVVKISILQHSITGEKVWEETHEVKTDDQGVYSIVIGQGKIVPGINKANIGQIEWSNGPFFLNTKLAIVPSLPITTGRPWIAEENFRDQGTLQMHSVPYALFNDNSWRDPFGNPATRESSNKRNPNASVSNGSDESQMDLNFKAEATDPLNNPAKNRTIFVKFAIKHGSKTGDIVWEETQETKTNDEGVFEVIVGKGKRISGIVKSGIGEIDWGEGPYFLNTKIAVAPSIPAVWWNPADNYSDMGTSEMHSLPYALYSKGNSISGKNSSNDALIESTEGIDRIRQFKQPKQTVPPVTNLNLNLNVKGGIDLTIPPLTTTIIDLKIEGVRKGDPIIVTPQKDSNDWSIYSSWVSEDDKVKIRFANYTKNEVKVLGTDYKVVVIK